PARAPSPSGRAPGSAPAGTSTTCSADSRRGHARTAIAVKGAVYALPRAYTDPFACPGGAAAGSRQEPRRGRERPTIEIRQLGQVVPEPGNRGDGRKRTRSEERMAEEIPGEQATSGRRGKSGRGPGARPRPL